MLEKYRPVIIGITGSVGKSSTKKAIYEILKQKHKVVCDKSKYDIEISIPLAVIGFESGGHSVFRWIEIIFKTIIKLFRKVDYPDILILEMGVNRPGDMKKMLQVVQPNIGIITNIGSFPSHTKYFKNTKHIAREKTLLIKSLNKKDLAILNFDDEFVRNLSLSGNIKSKIITYGFNVKSTVHAEEILFGNKKFRTKDGLMGMSFKISHNKTTVPFKLPYVLGRGQIYSTLSAVSVGLYFGFNFVDMSNILSNLHPIAGRMKMIKGVKESLIIDDSFNASPVSVLSALETVEKLEASRKIAVLGDMFELGEYCESGHKEVGKNISKSVDILLTYGSRSKIISNQAQKYGMKKEEIFHFNNMDELNEFLNNIIKKDDIVLVKGSRAMHMERVVRGIMDKPEKANELLVSL